MLEVSVPQEQRREKEKWTYEVSPHLARAFSRFAAVVWAATIPGNAVVVAENKIKLIILASNWQTKEVKNVLAYCRRHFWEKIR